MERLRGADFRAALAFQQEIYELADVPELRRRLMRALPGVVPADQVMIMESDLARKRSTALTDEPSAIAPPLLEAYGRHVGDSPLLKAYARGKGSAVKYSDFLTQRQFHRTGLYNEFFRHLGVEYRIAKGLPGAPGLVTAIYLDRRRGARDFGERDRLLLNLLRPHLNQAYRNATAVDRMRREIALFEAGVEAVDGSLVLLTPDGEPPRMSPRARRWITKYFGPSRKGGTHLPEPLERWLAFRARPAASALESPRRPLVVEAQSTRLVLRVIDKGTTRVLLLHEEERDVRPKPLEALGLSPREAEVLAWVAEGKTSGEIAIILALSRRTVEKHLERVFAKLGVETRTAAAAIALSARSALSA